MAKRVKLDENLCMGCGICASIYPEAFQVNEETYKCEFVGNPEDISDDMLDQVISSCPEQAISAVEESDENQPEESTSAEEKQIEE